MPQELRERIWKCRLTALMGARYFHLLKARFDRQQDLLSSALIVLSISVAPAAIYGPKWLPVVLGLGSALAAGLHRHWKLGEEAMTAAQYSQHCEQRADAWDVIWGKAQGDDESFGWQDFNLEVERDTKLAATRFPYDDKLSVRAFHGVLGELGLDA